MENLPPALQEFIRLRVTYPEATLKELGERATPPLSKAPSTIASAGSSQWPPSWTRGSSAGSPIEVVNGFSNFSLVLYFLQ